MKLTDKFLEDVKISFIDVTFISELIQLRAW